jgi:hypothetical protein
VDKQAMRAQRLELYALPDYMPRRNKSNDTVSTRKISSARPIRAWAVNSLYNVNC